MNKIKIAGVLAAFAAFALPVAASASTSLTNASFDGMSNETVTVGSSVDAKVTFNLTGNSTVQSVKYQVSGSGLAPVCVDVDDQNSTGTHTVEFPIDTTSATEGTHSVIVTAYGAPVPAANNNCDSTIGSSSSHTFSNQLTLTADQSTGTVANNTGTGTGGTGTGASSLSAQIAALSASINAFIQAQLGSSTTPPVATGNKAKCDAARPFLGAQPFAYSSVGVQLQSVLLLDDPTSIPALHAGATIPMGYFGPQTHAALTNFSSKYGCGFIFN